MKASAVKYAVLSALATLITVVMALMPFHALLTVWLSDALGHYTALRLWKEVLLAVAGLGVLYLLITDHKIRTHTLSRRLVWVIAAYIALLGVVTVVAYARGAVTPKAVAYGLLIDVRFLAFFLIAWAVALRTSRLQAQWFRILIIPAVIVIIFGVLQATVLPNDFLKHFGYGPATIQPVETVNENADYVRIMSTLRGPNPLGAYLILPLTVLVLTLFTGRRKWRVLAILLLGIFALFSSHSRSAFIGVFISVLVLLFLRLRTKKSRQVLAGIVAGMFMLGAFAGVLLQRNPVFQNVVLHTESNSTSPESSNDGHIAAFKDGVGDIVASPLGSGAGTAGPASVHNDGKANISENYFLQIGQETGVLGMGLFILINAGVGYLLWLRRREPLAVSLLASLIGISAVNLFLHAWADDTLAYVWWGLAGIAMASLPLESNKEETPSKV